MKKKTFLKAVALMTALIMTFAAWSPAAQAFAATAKKTKTVYVISQITSKSGSETYKFTYTKNGLVKKMTTGGLKVTYKYDKKKVSSQKQIDEGEKTEVLYSYSKKGRLKKTTQKEADGKKTTTKYKYKSGRLVEIQDNSTDNVWTLTYNKKGLVKKAVIKGKKDSTSTIKYSYNSKKDPKKMICSWDVTEKISYTYNKHGRKTATVKYSYKDKSLNSKEVYTYKYQKISVPASYAKAIKKQQKEMANTPSAFMFVLD